VAAVLFRAGLIDAGDAERDVAVDHHSFVEQAVEQVEHARLRCFEHLVGDGGGFRTLG